MRTQQYEIYLTTNRINNKKYIGLHSKSNPTYFGSGTLVTKAIKKYGKLNFDKVILETTNSITKANELERYYINEYNAVDNDMFYNLSYGGEYIAGRLHSPQTIQKIKSSKIQSYKNKPELRYKVGSANRGKSMPESTKNALMSYLNGHVCSESTKNKISARAIKRYNTAGKSYPDIKHKKTNEIIKSGNNISRLAILIDVSKGNLSELLSGKRKSCNGWEITNAHTTIM